MIIKYVKVGVVVFPGSNCDRDVFHVLSDVFKFDTEYYWHEKHQIIHEIRPYHNYYQEKL